MICNRCLVDKALEDFYAHPATLNGRSQPCKECAKQATKRNEAARKARDPEGFNKKKLAYRNYWRHAYPEKERRIKAAGIRRRRAQKLAALQAEIPHATATPTLSDDPERVRNRLKGQRYRKTHPENIRKLDSRHWAKHRAVKANAPAVENVDLDVLYLRDKGICQLGQHKIPRAQASRDHIIPLSQGGAHTYQNVVLACISCNAAKRDRNVPQQMRLF